MSVKSVWPRKSPNIRVSLTGGTIPYLMLAGVAPVWVRCAVAAGQNAGNPRGAPHTARLSR